MTRGQKLDTLRTPEKGFEPPGAPRRGGFGFCGARALHVTLSASDIEHELNTLRSMIGQLSPPLAHRPALFLEQKDALDDFVLSLMRRAGFTVKSPLSFTSPTRDSGVRFTRQARAGNGRLIPVERRRGP